MLGDQYIKYWRCIVDLETQSRSLKTVDINEFHNLHPPQKLSPFAFRRTVH
jgi:hypothetical protein